MNKNYDSAVDLFNDCEIFGEILVDDAIQALKSIPGYSTMHRDIELKFPNRSEIVDAKRFLHEINHVVREIGRDTREINQDTRVTGFNGHVPGIRIETRRFFHPLDDISHDDRIIFLREMFPNLDRHDHNPDSGAPTTAMNILRWLVWEFTIPMLYDLSDIDVVIICAQRNSLIHAATIGRMTREIREIEIDLTNSKNEIQNAKRAVKLLRDREMSRNKLDEARDRLADEIEAMQKKARDMSDEGTQFSSRITMFSRFVTHTQRCKKAQHDVEKKQLAIEEALSNNCVEIQARGMRGLGSIARQMEALDLYKGVIKDHEDRVEQGTKRIIILKDEILQVERERPINEMIRCVGRWLRRQHILKAAYSRELNVLANICMSMNNPYDANAYDADACQIETLRSRRYVERMMEYLVDPAHVIVILLLLQKRRRVPRVPHEIRELIVTWVFPESFRIKDPQYW